MTSKSEPCICSLGSIELSYSGEAFTAGPEVLSALKSAARRFGDERPKCVNAKVADALRQVSDVLQLVERGLIQMEAVKGIRLIQPKNSVSDELKLLSWAIATLNGVTDLPAPDLQRV